MDGNTYVATGEVTTLKHELGNDAVELGAGVAEALLAGAESTEVLSGLGDDLIVELEVDATGLLYRKQALAIAWPVDGHEARGRWRRARNGRRRAKGPWRGNGKGKLTLDGAGGGDIAVAVDLDLGTLPGNVEESLDAHVES